LFAGFKAATASLGIWSPGTPTGLNGQKEFNGFRQVARPKLQVP
jgi:hypothetical protein